MHGAASLLQVERRRIVFTGRGKRTDGQRTHVAERRGNFIGQSQPKKIQILVCSQILQGQHGKGFCTGGSHRRRGLTPGLPEDKRQHDGRNRNHGQRDLCVSTLRRGDRRRTTAPRHRAMLAGSCRPHGPGSRYASRIHQQPATSGVRVPLQALQVAAHLGSVLVTQVVVLLQSFVDDLFQAGGHIVIQAHGRHRRAIHNRLANHRRTLSVKGNIAGRHLVKHGAK